MASEDQNLSELAKKIKEENLTPIKLAEIMSKMSYSDMPAEEKVKWLKKANETLLKINKMNAKTKQEGGAEENDLQYINALIRIQAWYKGYSTRKKLVEEAIKEAEEEKEYADKDEATIHRLSKELAKIGMNLESFYKILEKSPETMQTTEANFIATLQRLNLSFSLAQSKRLMLIIDEDCKGYFTAEEYFQALEAFKIETIKYKKKRVNYGQLCVCKFCEILNRRKIELTEFIKLLTKSEDAKEKIEKTELSRVIEGLNTKLKKKEIRGVLNWIYPGPNSNTTIETGKLLDSLQACDKLHKTILITPDPKPIIKEPLVKSPIVSKNIPLIVAKMENASISIAEFISILGSTGKISLGRFLSKLGYYYSFTLEKEEKLALGKSVPLSEGFIDLGRLSVFLHQYANPYKERPVNVYFQIWYKYIIGVERLSVIEYIKKKCGIADLNIPKEDEATGASLLPYEVFYKQATEAVGLGEIVTKLMFKSMSKKPGSSSISAKELLRVLESYQQGEIASSTFQAKFCDFLSMLSKHKLTLQDVYNISLETDNQARVLFIIQAFKKLLPELDPDIVYNKFYENNIRDLFAVVPFDAFTSYFGKSVADPKNLEHNNSQMETRDAIYWINKLDFALLELRLAPTVVFENADKDQNRALTIKELEQAITSIIPNEKLTKKELLQIMKALDVNKNGVIEFDEFVNIFKSARASNLPEVGKSEGTLPVYGNLVFVKLDEETSNVGDKMEEKKETKKNSGLQQIKEKLSQNGLTLGMLIEKIKWDCTGKITINKLSKIMETVYSKALSINERYALCRSIDRKKSGIISVEDLIRWCENEDDSDISKEQILLLDYLYISFDYLSSKMETVPEYFSNIGMETNKRIQSSVFGSLLSAQYSMPEKQQKRLITHFLELSKQGNIIEGKIVIREIENFLTGKMKELAEEDQNREILNKILAEMAMKIRKDHNVEIIDYFQSPPISLPLQELINAVNFDRLVTSLGVPSDQIQILSDFAVDKVTASILADQMKKAYLAFLRQTVAKVEQDGIAAIERIERKYPQSLAECFGKAELQTSYKIKQSVLFDLMREQYLDTPLDDITTIAKLLNPKTEEGLTILEIQDFLKKYSLEKKPSVALECKLILYAAKSEGNINARTFIQKQNISLGQQFSLDNFMAKVIAPLEIDEKAGIIIFNELQEKNLVSTDKFCDFIESGGVKAQKKGEEKKSLSSVDKAKSEYKVDEHIFEYAMKLEKESEVSLIKLLENMKFNEENCIATASFSAILKATYPNSNLQENKVLARTLDIKLKGLISFNSIMAFILNNTQLSTFPNLDDITMGIARTITYEMKKTTKEYFEASSIRLDQFINVPQFVSLFGNQFGVSLTALYCLYDKIKPRTIEMALSTDIINFFEEKRERVISKKSEETKENAAGIIAKGVFLSSHPKNRGVMKLCEYLYPIDTKKQSLPEEEIFRLFDTDKDKKLTKVELGEGMKRLKVEFTQQEVQELVTFADKNNNNKVSLMEFLESLKGERERIIKEAKNNIIISTVESKESIYNKALLQIRKHFFNMPAEERDNIFVQADIDNNGFLTVEQFKDTLRKLPINLTEFEIDLVAKNEDKNNNGKIEYQEYAEYISQLDIGELSKGIQNRIKKAEFIPKQQPASLPFLKENIMKLKEQTNLSQYPIEAVMNDVDFPFTDFQIDISKHFDKMDNKTNKYKATYLNSKKAALLVAELYYRLLKTHEKFKDDEFGSTLSDIHGSSSIYPNGETPPSYARPDEIVWKRPSQIVKDPKFMDENGMNANDAVQGRIGDCYFITAASLIAAGNSHYFMGHLDPKILNQLEQNIYDNKLYENLCSGVFPPIFHMYAKKGLYVFRFFKNFKWRYVIIDDLLPTYSSNNELVFACSSGKNEFWISLMEKAYAKLHGSYYSLISGHIDEAIADMTGFTPEKRKLGKLKNSPTIALLDEEWDLISNTISAGIMIGCSVSGAPVPLEEDDDTREIERAEKTGVYKGIISGHAYGILDSFAIKKNIGKMRSRLLRVRNPHGEREWLGKWADRTEKFNENRESIKAYFAHEIQETKFAKYGIRFQNKDRWDENGSEDGTFLMCYKDWRRIYTDLFICGDRLKEGNWKAIRFEYELNGENNGGTPTKKTEEQFEDWGLNPQLNVMVRNGSADIFVVVSQEDGRMHEGAEFPFAEYIHMMCFFVLQCANNFQKRIEKFDMSKIRYGTPITNQREITGRVHLDEGNFVIVPSTRDPGISTKVWITVFYPINTPASFEFEFEDPTVKKTSLPKITLDPYAKLSQELQGFIMNRKQYFVFSQVIDRGIDASTSFIVNKEERKDKK